MLSILSLIEIPVFAQQRPNVIVILSDDGGYDDFGCYGGKEVHTPHIDERAKHGILFQCAYTSASVCALSRAEWEVKMAKPKWLSSVLDNDQNQIMKHRMEVVG